MESSFQNQTDNRVTPNTFTNPVLDSAFPSSDDPLNILDLQGAKTVIDTKSDPLSVLYEPKYGLPPKSKDVHSARLNDKMRDVFSLANTQNEIALENNRASKLVRL